MGFWLTLSRNNGVSIPQVAYGTWLSKPGEVARG